MTEFINTKEAQGELEKLLEEKEYIPLNGNYKETIEEAVRFISPYDGVEAVACDAQDATNLLLRAIRLQNLVIKKLIKKVNKLEKVTKGLNKNDN